MRHADRRAVAARQAQRGDVGGLEPEHVGSLAQVVERDRGRRPRARRGDDAVPAGDHPHAAAPAVGRHDALRTELGLQRRARQPLRGRRLTVGRAPVEVRQRPAVGQHRGAGRQRRADECAEGREGREGYAIHDPITGCNAQRRPILPNSAT
jgi:hypothetical protein